MRLAWMVLLLLASLWRADPAWAQGYVEEDPDRLAAAPEAPAYRAILPPTLDLSPRMPPVRDQGLTGTCTSWAVTYAAASHFFGRRGAERPLLSPAFTYNVVAGDPNCQKGSNIGGTLDMLRDVGALPVASFVFDAGWCGRRPSAAELQRAAQWRIPGWARLDARDVAAVKGQLAQGRPVIFALPIGAAFLGHRGAATFDVLETGAGLGGHAMVAIGYDDSRQAVLIQNSHGSHWGDGGRAWLSWRVWQAAVRQGFVISD